MPIEFRCTACGRTLRVADAMGGGRARCPACASVQDVPAAAAASVLASGEGAPVAPVAPSMEPPPPASPVADPLPESMLANRLLAGRTCPACLKSINIGDPVTNCPRCAGSHHEPCWSGKGGCSGPSCAPVEGSIGVDGAKVPAVPCVACGETIPKAASQCPHCGEWLTQFPVKFERGRDRIWGARNADIRHRSGWLRVGDREIQIEGMANVSGAVQALILIPCLLCGMGVLLVAILVEYLVLMKRVMTFPLFEIERAIFETDKGRLLLGVRPSGKKYVVWYVCRVNQAVGIQSHSDATEALCVRLEAVLGPERFLRRKSNENAPLVQDFALNW